VNLHVLWLFANATLSVLAGVAIVLWILRREYRPVIDRLDGKGRDEGAHPPETRSADR
jgi:hypothetical protein